MKKASREPDFVAPTVLARDPWQYVDLWLRRQSMVSARFYWDQARELSVASQGLPPTARPVTAYYCILNATKSLLESKSHPYKPMHGLKEAVGGPERGLRSEAVQVQASGVLPALMEYLGEASTQQTVTLYEALYNLPYLHRAFTITYRTAKELFIPISEPRFVTKDRSSECWFEALVHPSFASGHTTKKLPRGFERDDGVTGIYVVRKKARFKWIAGSTHETANLERLRRYHQKVRKFVSFIHGSSRLWYLRRTARAASDLVEFTKLPLAFMAMHRLSELARYETLRLARHLDADYNWLLTEFLDHALTQYIDELASEITGMDFMPPGIRT